MEKIESFKVNHLNLNSGLYVSRIDKCDGTTVTTFDLRFTIPNKEEPMQISGIHTIEHLGATFLRNSYLKDKILYFGPMGCRTGFYLVAFNELKTEDIYPLIIDMLAFIINYEGAIPGATPVECGNYKDQDLNLAKSYAQEYYNRLTTQKNFVYKE